MEKLLGFEETKFKELILKWSRHGAAVAVKACPKLYPDWNSFHHVPICRPAKNVSQM
eukprot:gene13626-15047_t